jgi:uncharacterized protein YbjT (DUF2867 family)
MTNSPSNPPLVLLTGATGYVGGRLLGALQNHRVRVRCIVRRPDQWQARGSTKPELMRGDVLDADSLTAAFEGVSTAYYLIHAMGAAEPFEEKDRQSASNFADAARAAGVRRIIYLGGLGDRNAELSPHLRSRHEVGEVLRKSGVQVIEFRASIIIGSGSLSFEMVRALVERLPVMIAPKWVGIKSQPIAIGDIIDYLIAALDLAVEGNPIYEIGGVEVVSYGDIMREYTRQRGLRRLVIPVPVLTPRLSSLWLGLVTPLYARVGRKLIESIIHPTVVRDDAAARMFSIRPKGMREALAIALRSEDIEYGATKWSDALSSSGDLRDWGGVRFGNRLVDSRVVHVEVTPARAFAPILRIGGNNGWHYGDWLWRLRGLLDLMVGGVGMRRGRRHPEALRVGDAIDCWRVENYVPARQLRLAAEMRLPGRAWLVFEVEPDGAGSTIRQTAILDPVGLSGLAYWYGIYPLHRLIFAGMLRGLARAAIDPVCATPLAHRTSDANGNVIPGR